MMWTLGALGFVRKALGAALAFIREKPSLAAIIALCAVCGWLWMDGSRVRRERDVQIAGRAADRAAYTNAQVEAARLALAAKAATEARYRAHAQEIDREHESQLADARSDVDRYIARMRDGRQAASSAGGKTVASADNRNPGVPAGLPANYVPVAESDLRACADATTYAVAAREWALGLAR